jgi:hypothetical protein
VADPLHKGAIEKSSPHSNCMARGRPLATIDLLSPDQPLDLVGSIGPDGP